MRFSGTRLRFVWGILLLCAIATSILAACGGAASNNPTPTTVATSAPTTQPTVATPSPTPTQPATVPLGAVIVQLVEKTPGDYEFEPSSITIKAGTVVVWMNNSDGKHTVTSKLDAPGAFNTPQPVSQNQTFAVLFTQPGTYHYQCTIHPKTMQAVITVTA